MTYNEITAGLNKQGVTVILSSGVTLEALTFVEANGTQIAYVDSSGRGMIVNTEHVAAFIASPPV